MEDRDERIQKKRKKKLIRTLFLSKKRQELEKERKNRE